MKKTILSVFATTSMALFCVPAVSLTLYENAVFGGWTQMEDYWGDRNHFCSNAVITLTGHASSGANYSYTEDNSILNLKNHAQLVGFVLSKDHSEIHIHGGYSADRMFADDQSTINVYGGEIKRLYGRNTGTINIFGGNIGDWILLYDQSSLNIWGTDLAMTFSQTNSNGTYYNLSGTLLDGTPLNQIMILGGGFSGNIKLYPVDVEITCSLSSAHSLSVSWGFDYNRFIIKGIPDLMGGFAGTSAVCVASSSSSKLPSNNTSIPLHAEQKRGFFRLELGKEVVSFPDHNFEDVVRSNIVTKTLPVGEIYDIELEDITNLTAVSSGIIDLSGIEMMTDLTSLNLASNLISDLTPIMNLVTNGGLAGLESDLILSGNPLNAFAITNQIPTLTNDFFIVVHWP